MIIYEVNISAIKPIDQRGFLNWLEKHIKDLEKIPGFLPQTQVFSVQDPETNFSLSVRYFLESQQSLQDYYKNHAPKMRGDLPEVFRDKLQFSRRELTLSEPIQPTE